MASINFVGNIGKDAELKNIGNKQYAVFNVGESRRYTDSNGQQQSETTWYRCMKADPNGRVATYLTKGVKVYVSGELRVSSYQGKDGQNHQDLSVWVNNFEFMSGGQRQQQPSAPQQIQNPKDFYDYATGGGAQQPRQQAQQPSQPTGGGDDLPF